MLLAQQVSVNYNHNANFLQYHTNAWVRTTHDVWGMRGIGGGLGGISPQQNIESTMVVSLYDTKQKELVWRRIAQGCHEVLMNAGGKLGPQSGLRVPTKKRAKRRYPHRMARLRHFVCYFMQQPRGQSSSHEIKGLRAAAD